MSAVLFTLALSTLSCGFYLGVARRRRILDLPNERSSHSEPTPNGGGVPLLLAFFAGLVSAGFWGAGWSTALVLLAGVASLLMVLGAADDLDGLPMPLRFLLYAIACAATALYLLWDLPGVYVIAPAAALAMLWLLNLYNFMDGIDGIAGLQAVLACGGAAALSGDAQYTLFCLSLAAAHAGFLVWNRPPAKLFMGDAGSVPTGFLCGGLALLGWAGGQLEPAVWVILLAVFVVDASWTLVWRMATGQAFTSAHRLHAYQRLSRHWNSHARVDLLFLAIGLFWLFPLAWAAHRYPAWGLFSVILAYAPLAFGMYRISHIK